MHSPPADSGSIRVVALGSAAAVLGFGQRSMPIAEGATVGQVFDALAAEFPRLAQVRRSLRFAVNERFAGSDAPLAGGDELAIIPPVSGG